MSAHRPVADRTSHFDRFDPSWTDNPYAIWDELRRTWPIAHTDRFMGVYFPSPDEAFRAVAYDTEHHPSRRLFVRKERQPVAHTLPVTLALPELRPQRLLLLPAFSPAAIERHVPRTRGICEDLAGRLSGRNECDGAMDYAHEIPARVMAHLLGVSKPDGELFRRWIHDFTEAEMTDSATSARVVGEMAAFFAEEIARRRVAPGDDLISELLDARVDGQAVSDDQINGMLRLLLFAGIDTTWNAIGSCLWHLATHPDDRQRLVAEPQLIPSAAEQFLRAGTPGDRVMFDRTENRHAAFGLGIHRCIGSHLARMEITVALEEWLRRFPTFALAPGADVKWSAGAVRGPRTLPLVLG